MKSNSQIERRNYHQQKDQQNSNANKIIHIFSTDLESPSIVNLEKYLKNKDIEFEYHFNFQEIQALLKQNNSQPFILVCEKEPDDENYDVLNKVSSNHQNQSARIFAYPQRIRGTAFPTLSDEREVIEAFDKNFKIKRNNQIRLSSIHSIKIPKDKSSSKSIKIITGSQYEKCFFFKSHYGQYGTQEESAYQQLIEALDGQAKFQAFKTTKQLQKKQAPKGKKKYVVLMPSDESAFKTILQLNKLDYLDFALLGKLKPEEDLLKGNIVLASNNSQKLIGFLIDKGFDSSNMRNIQKTFSKKQFSIDDKNSIGRDNTIKNNFLSNIINPNIQADPIDLNGNFDSPKGVSKLVIDDENGDKKKIKKIKSPIKTRGNQSQAPSQKNNISIVVSKHKDEPIYQNSQVFVNKQGQKIPKRESQNDRQNNSNRYVNSIQQEKNNGALNKYDAAASNPLENHFTKRSSGIQSKYRKNPSVIHQMSDEYKGSNKQSIVNLQPQRQKTIVHQNGSNYQFYQSEPVQQYGGKRVVTKGLTYSQSPQNYYINSQRTLQAIRSSSNIPQSNNYNQRGSSGTNGNIYSITNNTNNISYNRSTSPRIISAAPMTISSQPLNKQSSPNQTYTQQSALSYQSPSKIIKKEMVSPPQIVQKEPQSTTNLQNRYTFGNYLNNNKSSSKQINVNNSQRSSNIPSSNGSYYNVQTYNYGNTNGNQPYVSKIHTASAHIQHISSNATSPSSNSYRVEEHTLIGKRPQENNARISYQSNISSTNNHLKSPGLIQKQTKNAITSGGINLQEYQKIQRDGRTIYRKRVPLQSSNYNPSKQVNIQNNDDGSPKVIRYEASPKRINQTTTNRYVTDQRVKSPINPTYNEQSKVINYSNPNKKYEIISVPYKSSDNNLGDMIQSSHKKKTMEMNTLNSPNNFVGVSYRSQDKGGNVYSNSYQETTGVKVYGVNHPRITVERQDRYQPKVQAHTPSPKPASLNESNWFSRLSQLHSDGSILRRNNIRFGVKLHKKQEKIAQSHISVLENKLASGIYNVNDLNKKMALNRIIQGEEYLSAQKIKYLHINSKFNNFHFVIQEEMSYLIEILKDHITTKNDQIDKFAGVSSLYNCIKAQDDDSFDVGFIFAKPDEAGCINIQLIPENYYIVCITKDQEGLLQINQSSKKVKIDQMKYFTLAQKIILDSKLYEYVAYRNNRQEIENLADKFLNTQFILEKIQTQFSTQILDCYYYELPRLTRVYVLCDQQQLPKMMKLVKAYEEINPNFDSQTCRLLCVINNILGNGQLIMNEPNVTFISNPEKIMSHEDILGYVHHYDDQVSSFLPIDNIFYYFKHNSLDEELANVYPGRFATFSFKRLTEIYPKIERINKLSSKYVNKPKNYLVLHEDLNSEKIKMDYFFKVFMLGKTKLLQNKVTRVININELIQLLK